MELLIPYSYCLPWSYCFPGATDSLELLFALELLIPQSYCFHGATDSLELLLPGMIMSLEVTDSKDIQQSMQGKNSRQLWVLHSVSHCRLLRPDQSVCRTLSLTAQPSPARFLLETGSNRQILLGFFAKLLHVYINRQLSWSFLSAFVCVCIGSSVVAFFLNIYFYALWALHVRSGALEIVL